MLKFLALALGLIWLVGVTLLHITGTAFQLLLLLPLATLAGQMIHRRLLLRRSLVGRRLHPGPPLQLRSGGRGQHFIVS